MVCGVRPTRVIRFSFAFFTTSSRSRLKSGAEAPPYSLPHLKEVALLISCYLIGRTNTIASAAHPDSLRAD